MATVHATCLVVDGTGVLLRGEPGCGKSDLALRAMDAGCAMLVADDRVELAPCDGAELWAAPPPALAGLIEVRGLGIVRRSYRRRARVRLVVDLVPREAVERLPEQRRVAIAGVELPLHSLWAFDLSALAKLRTAVRHAVAACGWEGSLDG